MLNEKCSTIIKFLLTYEHLPYVVTKGWDTLGDETTELLVLDRAAFVKQTKLMKDTVANEQYRTLYTLKYGVKRLAFEVRELADNYYPAELGNRLLKGRVKHPEHSIYILNQKDIFFEMLYYCRYRLGAVSNIDYTKLRAYAPGDYKGAVDDHEYMYNFLNTLGYFPVKCKDQSVGYWP